MKLCKICSKPAKNWFKYDKVRRTERAATCGDKACVDALRVQTTSSKLIPCDLCHVPFAPKSGRSRWCIECVPSHRWRARASKYAVGKKRWETLLNQQGGTCALCPAAPEVVDHDHSTNVVRGLLCFACNSLLAGLDMDRQWIEKALAYKGVTGANQTTE